LSCVRCGDRSTVYTPEGYLCASCLFARVSDGYLSFGGECDSCGEQAQVCYDHQYSSCQYCDCTAEICEHCAEEQAGEQPNACDECGTDEEPVYCRECANELWYETPGLAAVEVDDDGSMTMGDMEIVWH